MVVIRLARGGSKKRPFYNVVVTDSRMRRDSHSIERLGYYNPVAAGADVRLHFEEDRVNYWLSKGAQMSDPACSRTASLSPLRKAPKRRPPPPPRTLPRRPLLRLLLTPRTLKKPLPNLRLRASDSEPRGAAV